MFDLPANDTGAGDNSQLTISDKRKGMDTYKNNIISSPAIINGMSHEMRTHMNAIVAFSFLMKEDCCKNSDCEDFSSQILNSCEQLIKLFESFLDTAIIDSGGSETDTKICNIDNILGDLLSEFRDIIKKENNSDLRFASCRINSSDNFYRS